MKKKKTSDFAMTIKLAFDIDGGAFLPDDGSPWSWLVDETIPGRKTHFREYIRNISALFLAIRIHSYAMIYVGGRGEVRRGNACAQERANEFR